MEILENSGTLVDLANKPRLERGASDTIFGSQC
jgi:hypothetical protein